MVGKTLFKKIQPKYFEAVLNGQKTFEIRKNDCDYEIGDRVVLKEIGTENTITVLIKYVLKDIPEYGLDKDYCIFSFEIEDRYIGSNEED